MKKLILILCLVFTASSFAGTPAKLPSLTIAERVFTDLTGVIVLNCTTLTGYTSCTKNGTTYTAGGASGFRIIGIKIGALGSTTDTCGVGYDDIVRISVGGSPPPPLVEFGVGGTGSLNNRFLNAPANTAPVPFQEYVYPNGSGPLVPTGKIPWLVCGSAGSYKTAEYYGIEE